MLLAGLLGTVVGCGDSKQSAYLPADMARAIAIRDTLGGGAAEPSSDDDMASGGAKPTGWATLKGTFQVVGDPPKPTPLRVDKDESVCAPGGKQVFGERLLVDDSGGIRNVVIYVTSKLPAESPWMHPDAAPGKTDVVEFDQKQCLFLSHVLALQTSQTLKLVNSDPVGHNAKFEPKENAPFNQIIPGGSASDYKFSAEEAAPFPVSCSIHPWMNASILVRDNGYFAVTAEDGSFEIPNLPAGIDLEFRVWQEKSRFVSDVVVNGEPATWKKGRFTMNLDPADETKNRLDVKIDAGVFK